MRRIPLALALVGAVAVTGCMGGTKSSATADSGVQKGVAGQSFFVNFFTIPEGGIIQSSDSRINCGAGSTACGIPSTPVGGISAVKGQTEYAWFQADGATLTTVTLTATPTAGNAFLAWAGDCGLANSAGNVCTLTAGADRMVAAVFGPPGSGHGDFSSGAVHGAALQAGTLDCKTCHAGGAGQANAPACSACHQGIINTSIARVPVTEACEHCHSAGAWSASTLHALKNQVAVSNVAIDGSGADIVITYNVKVDGVNRNDFTTLAGLNSWVYSSTSGTAMRTTLTLTGTPVVSNGNGNYTLTIPGFGATGATPGGCSRRPASWSARRSAPPPQPQATFLAHYTTGNVMPGVLVSNQACLNCHGDFVFKATRRLPTATTAQPLRRRGLRGLPRPRHLCRDPPRRPWHAPHGLRARHPQLPQHARRGGYPRGDRSRRHLLPQRQRHEHLLHRLPELHEQLLDLP